jgi:hypothetical protein
MAPSIIPALPKVDYTRVVSKGAKAPLKSSGSLDQFEKVQVTPVIGTEFKEGIQIVALLNAPNSDDLIRELAILGTFESSASH